MAGRNRSRHRENGLLRRQKPADLAEQDVEVLRLDRHDDERRAGDSFAVRERSVDAVPLLQLVDSLLSPACDDDVTRLAPSRADQTGKQRLADLPGAENRDLSRGHPGSLTVIPRAPPGSAR